MGVFFVCLLLLWIDDVVDVAVVLDAAEAVGLVEAVIALQNGFLVVDSSIVRLLLLLLLGVVVVLVRLPPPPPVLLFLPLLVALAMPAEFEFVVPVVVVVVVVVPRPGVGFVLVVLRMFGMEDASVGVGVDDAGAGVVRLLVVALLNRVKAVSILVKAAR